MVKALFVDMDNTLIETQIIYETANQKLVDYIVACGSHDPAAVLEKLQKTTIDAVVVLGYSAELLPNSFEATFRHFVTDPTAEEIRLARALAYQVYTTQAKIKDGVEEALRQLEPHFEIYLLTVGDSTIQQRRIDAIPFKDVFKKVFIVDEKDKATFERVLKQAGIDPSLAVMIGDSLRSDIVPAVSAGLFAIHIPAMNWHGREMAGHALPEERATTHQSFLDAAAHLIRTHIKPAGPKPPQGPSA